MYKSAKKIPYKHEVHGDVRPDDYFWMRERDTPDVLAFLEQENRRTAEALKSVETIEAQLFQEMKARIKEDDSSVPRSRGPYSYFSKFVAGQEYAFHCRKPVVGGGSEQVLLDENQVAKGHTYCQVGGLEVSPNHKLLAYAVDTVGRRLYTLKFRDLDSQKDLPDQIGPMTAEFFWSADNKSVFYVKQDPDTLRSFQLYRYRIGDSSPELVFEEGDNTFNVGLSASKDRKRIYFCSWKRDATEWYSLNTESLKYFSLQKRQLGHEYSVVDGGDRVYVLSNWDAENFRLFEAPFECQDRTEWKEIIAHSPVRFLEDVDVYQDFIAVSLREQGLAQIEIVNRKNLQTKRLKFDEPVYELSQISLPEFSSSVVRFAYESLVQPPAVFEEAAASGERVLKKEREVPTYDKTKYETKRLWVKAADGAEIPVSLLKRKDVAATESSPLLLYGYGSYGLSMPASFRGSVISLVDRGFTYAIAHIRGGSEMGRKWYEQGRLQLKMNTFSDFIACAEKLIADKQTSPKHLYMMGGSAGGLLMGAVMNLRPELFNGVVAAVPFVDVMTTMLDESIPLTTGEYREWGDPRIKDQYAYMRQYSPYDNIRNCDYPNVLVTTGYHDSQVQYWEPAKWVAKLRDCKTNDNLLLLYTELEAGHSGATGRFEALKTIAKEYAFFILLEGSKG